MTTRRTRRLTALAAASAALLAAATASPSAASAASAHLAADDGIDRHLWDDRITESSGLARSTYARPLLWTHNDSGDSARVFAIKADGNTRATLTLDGAEHVDWEDISTGPEHSIWVADIGDNGWDRDHISVYKFTEPKDVRSGEVDTVRFDLAYPDGARDAEAIMVRPRTGRLFVISKVKDGGAVYRAPKELSTSSVNTLQRVSSAPSSVTGASFAPDGGSYVLVSYTRVFVYSRIAGSVVSETSKVNNSAQGESVEIARDGQRLFLGQEGDDSPVYVESYSAP